MNEERKASVGGRRSGARYASLSTRREDSPAEHTEEQDTVEGFMAKNGLNPGIATNTSVKVDPVKGTIKLPFKS